MCIYPAASSQIRSNLIKIERRLPDRGPNRTAQIGKACRSALGPPRPPHGRQAWGRSIRSWCSPAATWSFSSMAAMGEADPCSTVVPIYGHHTADASWLFFSQTWIGDLVDGDQYIAVHSATSGGQIWPIAGTPRSIALNQIDRETSKQGSQGVRRDASGRPPRYPNMSAN
jgi:hypothetical protein